LLRKQGWARIRDECVEVEAPGYAKSKVFLDTVADRSWDIYGPPLPQIEARLVRLP
jgi:hypothetical protein